MKNNTFTTLLSTAAAGVILLAVAGTATAQLYNPAPTPLDHRRTLHAPMGQEMLKFEAPVGMCFADPTKPMERAMVEQIQTLLREKGDEDLIGFFAPCNSLVNAGNPEGPEGTMISMGILTWVNRAIGEKTDMTRADYLDFRAPSFSEYLALNLAPWTQGGVTEGDTIGPLQMDTDVRQDANGVFSGFTQDMTVQGQKLTLLGVAGTTSLRNHPVEVVMRLNRYNDIDTSAEAYDLMEKFLAQQVALNP